MVEEETKETPKEEPNNSLIEQYKEATNLQKIENDRKEALLTKEAEQNALRQLSGEGEGGQAGCGAYHVRGHHDLHHPDPRAD